MASRAENKQSSLRVLVRAIRLMAAALQPFEIRVNAVTGPDGSLCPPMAEAVANIPKRWGNNVVERQWVLLKASVREVVLVCGKKSLVPS